MPSVNLWYKCFVEFLDQISKGVGVESRARIRPIDLGGWVCAMSSLLRDPTEIHGANSCEVMSSPLFSTKVAWCVPDLIDQSSSSDNGETEPSDSSLSEDDAPFLVSSSESSDDESPERDSSDDELPGVFTGSIPERGCAGTWGRYEDG